MPTRRLSVEEALEQVRKIDWAKSDRLTDAEIAIRINQDPDAAPDLADELAAGEFRVERLLDVAAIRARSGLTQRAFAERFGLPLRQLQDWEQRRKRPSGAAGTYLRLIAQDPDAVASIVRALADDGRRSPEPGPPGAKQQS
ncbi:MAG TPA: helix-turn-helix domain-containing protein [Geminicoccaceae bacterium]